MKVQDRQACELFGCVVAGHIGVPRQVMRRYKSVPPGTSVRGFLGALRSELRQGSLARIRFVRAHREQVALELRHPKSDTTRQMMSKARALLELSRRESKGMVEMARAVRDLQRLIEPLEIEVEAFDCASSQLETSKTAERSSLTGRFADLSDLIEKRYVHGALRQGKSDPYKGTARLTDLFDLSDGTLASVMPDTDGAAVADQTSRFVSGVLLPRLEALKHEIAGG